MLVDTLGLVIAIVVHAANIQDRDCAKLLLDQIRNSFRRIRLIWSDGGCAEKLVRWVSALLSGNPLKLEIVKRSDQVKGFYVLPHRWVVEGIFGGWLSRHREQSKDHEYLPETSASMIPITMIKLMTRRFKIK
jgi:putative transposase